MPRGNATQSKCHYHGKDEDFVIFVDDVTAVKNWKSDRSIPLAQVVSGFKIFVTHKYACARLTKNHSTGDAYLFVAYTDC